MAVDRPESKGSKHSAQSDVGSTEDPEDDKVEGENAYCSEIQRSDASKTRKQAVRNKGVPDIEEVEANLRKHRAPRAKDDVARELVMKGLKQNRFCHSLEDGDLQTIFDEMECFAFKSGETIVQQGNPGAYFFVSFEGSLEVTVDGHVTNTLERGNAFGAIALLYSCPRTASVVAKTAASMWGIPGSVFRSVVKENANKNYAQNRKLLDHVSLFDGLSSSLKGRVGELALFNEWFEAGSRVVTAGEAPTAVYVVKSGALSVISGGHSDDKGAHIGGKRVLQLGPGDCFGEQCLLRDEKRSATVLANERSELVCIGIQQLKEVLGQDLAAVVEHTFMLSTLRKVPVISHLSLAQLHRLVDAMKAKSYKAGDTVEDGLRVVVVIDGELADKDGGRLARGTWKDDIAKMLEGGSTSGLNGLVAGPEGARLALLTKTALANALQGLGLASLSGSEDGANDYMRKALVARKVPLFRNLSDGQVDSLVKKLALQEYTRDTDIFQQGDIGSTFFVIAEGELHVIVDRRLVRTLSKGATFGERALLLDEARSATVRVSSTTAQLWCMDRVSFEEVITPPMRQELVKRVQLQDTSISLRSLRHVRLIGAGSFGSVRLVEHYRTGTRYALKRVMKVDGQIPPEVERECYLLAEMDHPFVICMVRTFATQKSVYILMELVTGGQLLDRGGTNVETLNRKQAQFCISSLALILEALHERGIVYRDLKPENVMLDAQGYLKLVDFGIAKKLSETEPRTYTMIGTLFYIAPELIHGRGYGLEVDIWALGVMMYELVCGSLPFGDSGGDEQSILTSILDDSLKFPSRYVDMAGKRLMKDLLVKNPKKRLGSGIKGWSEIKASKYFSAGGVEDLFGQIAGRELPAPFRPQEEIFTDEAQLKEDGCTLSDSEELYSEKREENSEDQSDAVISRLRVCLQKVGASKEGIIDRTMFGKMLKELDATSFSSVEDADRLWEVMDPKNAGPVPIGRIVLVQDQIAAKVLKLGKADPKGRIDAKALSHLSTRGTPSPALTPPPGVRPPSEARTGRPAPRPGGATLTVAPPRPGRSSSKLRKEVATSRSSAEEPSRSSAEDDAAWRTLPSVASWYIRCPTSETEMAAAKP
mmetsp:Transcript_81961/g.265538  ORF Transcript_81961/g.265538 Transcript_81961/m.265538 type:complete len:1106 (+) Transcript_81961:97-3414(+)